MVLLRYKPTDIGHHESVPGDTQFGTHSGAVSGGPKGLQVDSTRQDLPPLISGPVGAVVRSCRPSAGRQPTGGIPLHQQSTSQKVGPARRADFMPPLIPIVVAMRNPGRHTRAMGGPKHRSVV